MPTPLDELVSEVQRLVVAEVQERFGPLAAKLRELEGKFSAMPDGLKTEIGKFQATLDQLMVAPRVEVHPTVQAPKLPDIIIQPAEVKLPAFEHKIDVHIPAMPKPEPAHFEVHVDDKLSASILSKLVAVIEELSTHLKGRNNRIVEVKRDKDQRITHMVISPSGKA